MTTREKAPTILTAEGARRLTDRLVTTLTEAHELLIDLWVGRAWEALEYPNWDAYCKAELGDLLMVKLPPAMRREAAGHMKDAGMSYRNIASPFGVSPASIHADLKPAPSVQKLNTATAGEGAVSPSPTPESRADQIVRLVASRGDRGATSPEVARLARCSQGAASGGLSRLHRQGRLRPTREQRGGFGIYVVD